MRTAPHCFALVASVLVFNGASLGATPESEGAQRISRARLAIQQNQSLTYHATASMIAGPASLPEPESVIATVSATVALGRRLNGPHRNMAASGSLSQGDVSFPFSLLWCDEHAVFVNLATGQSARLDGTLCEMLSGALPLNLAIDHWVARFSAGALVQTVESRLIEGQECIGLEFRGGADGERVHVVVFASAADFLPRYIEVEIPAGQTRTLKWIVQITNLHRHP